MARNWNDVCAIMALISWTLLPRVPSECLPIARQRTGEDVTSDGRQERKAAIGLVDRKLIIKPNKGKHMTSGSRIVRVCICDDFAPESLELHVP